MGKALDFNVYWDSGTGTVRIESGAPYTGRAPEPASDLEQVRQEMVSLVNQVRRENGVPELSVDERLMVAAQVCSDRRCTWHHTQEECEAVAASGYPYGFGNNLTVFTGAATADIAQRAVNNWKNSPGHFRTMLAADADSVGVGVTVEQGVTYCYLFIGRPSTINPYRITLHQHGHSLKRRGRFFGPKSERRRGEAYAISRPGMGQNPVPATKSVYRKRRQAVGIRVPQPVQFPLGAPVPSADSLSEERKRT